jgi:hypothetical protein
MRHAEGLPLFETFSLRQSGESRTCALSQRAGYGPTYIYISIAAGGLCWRTRLENVALRHQLGVLRRSAPKQSKLTPTDRIFRVWLRRVWAEWKCALMIVQIATIIGWHRKGFRLYRTWR